MCTGSCKNLLPLRETLIFSVWRRYFAKKLMPCQTKNLSVSKVSKEKEGQRPPTKVNKTDFPHVITAQHARKVPGPSEKP